MPRLVSTFCGKREWGLRPDTQTTCPTAGLERHHAHLAVRQCEVVASRRQLQNPSTEPNRLPQQQLITGATVPACIQGMAAGQVPDGQRIGFGP